MPTIKHRYGKGYCQFKEFMVGSSGLRVRQLAPVEEIQGEINEVSFVAISERYKCITLTSIQSSDSLSKRHGISNSPLILPIKCIPTPHKLRTTHVYIHHEY